MSLRDLLIQRAARLQEYPALSAPGWGELSYPAFRNRVEGVAFGLMASAQEACFSRTGGPWDWACEVACASCGCRWTPAAASDPALFGGALFNHEDGRQPYHDREVLESTPFCAGLNHGDLLQRLRRLNRTLGWDHATVVALPLPDLATPAVRAALWSALYAGSHARLEPRAPWDPTPFQDFWSE